LSTVAIRNLFEGEEKIIILQEAVAIRQLNKLFCKSSEVQMKNESTKNIPAHNILDFHQML
jgi:hypothetical protein